MRPERDVAAVGADGWAEAGEVTDFAEDTPAQERRRILLPVANEETLVFSIDVTPMNETSRFSVRYMKQFYVN